jgi:cytochrome c biogenesis protein CcmG/thiol:disulfide interchange protein DsbE
MERGLGTRLFGLADEPALRALACATVLGLSGCGPSLPRSIQHPLVGYACPEFEETTIDGQAVNVHGYLSSHVTVIDFWASWCGSCQDTMPSLEALHQERRGEGLVVVGVSVDDGPEEAARGAQAFGVTFPIVHDTGHKLATAFSVYQVPTTFVIDRAGAVRYVGRDPANIRRAAIALMDQ